MNGLLTLVIAVVRAWVGTYTRGLPADLRAERREEIDCDLWEHHRLAEIERITPTGAAGQILFRFIPGIPADILWRVEAGASIAKGRTSVNDRLFTSGLVTAGVVVALSFVIVTSGAWYWMLGFAIMIGIAVGVIAFIRVRQRGAAASTAVEHSKADAGDRWKWLLLVVGICVATVGGMWTYAMSLEEWGEARSMIFNIVGPLAMVVGLIALVLLVRDVMEMMQRKTNN